MFEMRRRYSFEDKTKRSIFLTIFVLCALLLSPAVLAGEAPDDANTRQEKTFKIPTPFGEVPVSEEYRTEFFVALGILALLYYGPTMFGRLRETVRESKSNVKSLEAERMRLENLKIKCEIEAIIKTNDLSMPDLVVDPKEVENVAISAETKVGTSLKFNTLVRPQLDELDARQRFVFRKIVAFFIDYFFLVFMVGFLIGFLGAIYDVFQLGESALFIIVAISAILYFTGMWATLGATVGLKIVGLKIISLDGRTITPKEALIRFAVWVVSNVFGCIGFFWILFDKDKLSLADKVAKTVVVKVRGHLEQPESEFIPEG
jgi:uncharacterized RDD family membrane protein YckC